MENAQYLMNSETREIFAYSETLAKMTSPKFVPFTGKLPPPDFRRGVPVAPEAVDVSVDEEVPQDKRVEVIAGILHIVPKEEISETGQPSLVAIEKLTGVKGVTRKEVNAAMKLRLEFLNSKNKVVQAAKVQEQDETEGE